MKDPDPAADSGTGAMAQARPLFVPADCPRSGRISTVPAALAGLPSGAGFGDGHAALAETLAEDFAGRLEAAPASPESDEDYRVRWDVEAWYSDYRYKLLFGRHAYVRMNLEAEQRATGY